MLVASSVNTYKSRDEVIELLGVDDLVGVSQQNFTDIIGDYHFPDGVQPLNCGCLKKHGRVCKQAHRNGYVVALKGGGKSLLGSSCVKDFDKDGNLRKSVSTYDKRKEFEENLRYVNGLYYEKRHIVTKLEKASKRLEEVRDFHRSLIETLPDITSRRLSDMARTGNSDISVELVFIRKGKDAITGELLEDRLVQRHHVGSVAGVRIFSQEFWQGLIQKISDALNFVSTMEYIKPSESSIRVKKMARKLREIDTTCNEVDAVYSDKKLFELSDKKPLIFLAHDIDQRAKLYWMWSMQPGNEPVSLSQAKNEIRNTDERILRDSQAQELRTI